MSTARGRRQNDTVGRCLQGGGSDGAALRGAGAGLRLGPAVAVLHGGPMRGGPPPRRLLRRPLLLLPVHRQHRPLRPQRRRPGGRRAHQAAAGGSARRVAPVGRLQRRLGAHRVLAGAAGEHARGGGAAAGGDVRAVGAGRGGADLGGAGGGVDARGPVRAGDDQGECRRRRR